VTLPLLRLPCGVPLLEASAVRMVQQPFAFPPRAGVVVVSFIALAGCYCIVSPRLGASDIAQVRVTNRVTIGSANCVGANKRE
jgi:hypothetical protein